MRLALKIARAELRTLFYSPIAWVVIVVFFVITGVLFVDPLVDISRVQEVAMENSPYYEGNIQGYTLSLFAGTFDAILSYLYLFIPFLTMGAISRELNNGTIKFLYSSPVRIRELVLGKYLGLLFFNFFLLAAIAILLITGMFSIQHVEYKVYLSAFLGIFLLSSTYTAIGLFISSLTSYQLVAGVATFLVFILLTFMANIGQQYDFVRDLTWFLSLPSRVDRMITGLITSRDVFYFLLIIILFLAFSMVRLKSTQESKKRTALYFRYLVVFAVILSLGYFSSRPGQVLYLDVTENKKNTIDSTVQNVIKELDGSPITVTLFTNLLDDRVNLGAPENRNNYVWNYWEKYRRFYPNINMKYEYYYKIGAPNSYLLSAYQGKTVKEIAQLTARQFGLDFSLFKTPEEIEKRFDFSKEPPVLLMELEYKGKKAVLRTFPVDPKWPGDPTVAGTLRRLVRDTTPKVFFSTGHFERSPDKFGEREYSAHTKDVVAENALVNQGVDVDTLSLMNNAIPANAAMLVVADPKTELAPVEQQRITEFLDKGGNAIFYAESGKLAMLEPVLNRLGVQLNKGTLYDQDGKASYIDMDAKATAAGNELAGEEAMQIYKIKKDKGASAWFTRPATISYEEKDGFTIRPIFSKKGNDHIWVENGLYVADSAEATFSVSEGDLRKDEYILGIQMTRAINGKEQRIVITGDADHMSRLRGNGASVFNAYYSWLMYNEYPVYKTMRFQRDTLLSIGRTTGKILYNVYVYLLPGTLLAFGIILLIRRKRK